MIKRRLISVLMISIAVSLALTACGTESEGALGVSKPPSVQTGEIADQEVAPIAVGPSNAETRQENLTLDYWIEEVPRSDEQGAVSIVITPLNLNQAWETIDFQVKMTTHSVDLSMDLAVLATLSTGKGHAVQATRWDGPSGGHHISGMLSFPASVDGLPLLNGVSKMTLTLLNVDVPERVFIWER